VNLSDLPLVLTVEELRQALRISRGAAYAAIREGRIPTVRVGRTIRIPRRAVARLLGETDEPSV
jgi:excisionase family DNA binding protein